MERNASTPCYAALFQAAPGETAVLDLDFRIVAVNDAYVREWKLSREALVGQSIFDTLIDDPTRARSLRDSLERVLDTRASDRMAAWPRGAPTKCGPSDEIDERYDSAWNYPILDEDGRVINVVHQVEDVTELVLLHRREVEREAELSEAIKVYEAIYDQGLFAGRLDLDGVVIDANRSCLDQCGFKRQDVLGKPFWECGWWNRSAAVQSWVKGAFERARHGEPFRGESAYYWADGTERVVEFSCIPIKDRSGHVLFVIATGIDVTERFQVERDRRATAILESTTDAFFALGRDWRFTYVNRQAEHVLTVPSDLLGKVIWDVFPGLEGTDFQRAYLRAAGERAVSSVTSYYPDHDRWYEVHAYPVKMESPSTFAT